MTNDEIIHRAEEETGKMSTPSPRRGRWWRRAWRAFVTYSDGNTKRKTVMVGAVFVAIGFQLVIWQLRTLSDDAREQDRYSAELTAFTAAQSAYALCLDSVARSDNNRAQWEQLAVIVEQLDGGAPYAEQIRNGPLLSAEPRSVDDCPKPGDPPVRPGD